MTTVVYAPENWTADPTAHPAARLLAGECTGCGAVFLRSPRVCFTCPAGTVVRDRPLGSTGTLYSHTVIHRGPANFATPYAVAYVDLPEGPRVFGHLDVDRPAVIGAPVEIYAGPIGRDRDDNTLVGARFRPLETTTEVS